MIKKIFHIFQDSSGSFEGQEENEQVVLLLRRHHFIILMRIGTFLIASLAPLVIILIFGSVISHNNLWALFWLLSGLWWLFFWLAIFYALTMYSLNVIIITNHRIVDNDQYGLFNRKVSELHLSRIQDVSVHTHGFIETFLRFGDIVVQTAGTESQFTFYQMPNPENTKDVITRLAREHNMEIKKHDELVDNTA